MMAFICARDFVFVKTGAIKLSSNLDQTNTTPYNGVGKTLLVGQVDIFVLCFSSGRMGINILFELLFRKYWTDFSENWIILLCMRSKFFLLT